MKSKLITFKQLQYFCFRAKHYESGVTCDTYAKTNKCSKGNCPYWKVLPDVKEEK